MRTFQAVCAAALCVAAAHSQVVSTSTRGVRYGTGLSYGTGLGYGTGLSYGTGLGYGTGLSYGTGLGGLSTTSYSSSPSVGYSSYSTGVPSSIGYSSYSTGVPSSIGYSSYSAGVPSVSVARTVSAAPAVSYTTGPAVARYSTVQTSAAPAVSVASFPAPVARSYSVSAAPIATRNVAVSTVPVASRTVSVASAPAVSYGATVAAAPVNVGVVATAGTPSVRSHEVHTGSGRQVIRIEDHQAGDQVVRVHEGPQGAPEIAQIQVPGEQHHVRVVDHGSGRAEVQRVVSRQEAQIVEVEKPGRPGVRIVQVVKGQSPPPAVEFVQDNSNSHEVYYADDVAVGGGVGGGVIGGGAVTTSYAAPTVVGRTVGISAAPAVSTISAAPAVSTISAVPSVSTISAVPVASRTVSVSSPTVSYATGLGYGAGYGSGNVAYRSYGVGGLGYGTGLSYGSGLGYGTGLTYGTTSYGSGTGYGIGGLGYGNSAYYSAYAKKAAAAKKKSA